MRTTILVLIFVTAAVSLFVISCDNGKTASAATAETMSNDVLIKRVNLNRAAVLVCLAGYKPKFFPRWRHCLGYAGDGIGHCHGRKGLRPARGRAGWLVSWRLLKSFVQQSRR